MSTVNNSVEYLNSYSNIPVQNERIAELSNWGKIRQLIQDATHLRREAAKLNPLLIKDATSLGLDAVQKKLETWLTICDENIPKLSGKQQHRMKDCKELSEGLIDELKDIKNGAQGKTLLCAVNKKGEIQAIMLLAPGLGGMNIEELVTHPDNIIHPNKARAGSRLIVAACQYALRHGYQQVSTLPLQEAETFYKRFEFKGDPSMQLMRPKFAGTLKHIYLSGEK